MGGHDIDRIIQWISNNLNLQITKKESENLVSYVGLFLPFECEMETMEEDFEFVQKRCTLIPPAKYLMWEWSAQVKLMEKNVRIARGYTTEKPIQITRHSVGLSYRFGRKHPSVKRSAKRICVSPRNSKELLPSVEEADTGGAISSLPSDDTCVNHGQSIDSAWGSPRQMITPFENIENQEQEESKSCEEMCINSESIGNSILSFDQSEIEHLSYLKKQTKNLESIEDFQQEDSDGG